MKLFLDQLPQRIEFRNSITLEYQCSVCHNLNQFTFTLQGTPNSAITHHNPLTTKYYSKDQIEHFISMFTNLVLIKKGDHLIAVDEKSTIAQNDQFPVQLFQHNCAECKHELLFKYRIGYGETERGLNESNILILQDYSRLTV
jgi:DNA-directed RNA polymerase subunit RPC12/RpoP